MAPRQNRSIVIVAACALLNESGDVLIAKRPAGRPLAGLWEFPGGKMLDGESAGQAAAREVLEETGLSVEPVGELGSLVSSQPELSVILHLVLCRRLNGFASPCDSSVLEVRWVTCEELAVLPMPPANAEIVARICPMPA